MATKITIEDKQQKYCPLGALNPIECFRHGDHVWMKISNNREHRNSIRLTGDATIKGDLVRIDPTIFVEQMNVEITIKREEE